MRRRSFEESGPDIKRQPETTNSISAVVPTEAASDSPVGADRSEPVEAPTEASGLAMPPGFQRIITHQFQEIDEYAEYMELRGSLRFNGRASSLGYGELLDALDAAEDCAHRGSALAARANVALVEFEIDATIIAGSLRQPVIDDMNAAKAALKKETGATGKQITNEDIEAEISRKYPDEWASLASRRVRAKESVKLFGDLAEKLAERARDLRTMVGKSRAVE